MDIRQEAIFALPGPSLREQLQEALNANGKDLLSKSIFTRFSNAWNQFKKILVCNFVFLQVRGMLNPGNLAHKFISRLQLCLLKHLWHLNKSAFFLVILSQAKYLHLTGI